METPIKNTKPATFKKLGFFGIGLCAVICAIPIIGTVLGVAALSTAAVYFENIGMLVLILSIGSLAIWLIRRKKASTAPSCDIDCGCKTEATTKA